WDTGGDRGRHGTRSMRRANVNSEIFTGAEGCIRRTSMALLHTLLGRTTQADRAVGDSPNGVAGLSDDKLSQTGSIDAWTEIATEAQVLVSGGQFASALTRIAGALETVTSAELTFARAST